MAAAISVSESVATWRTLADLTDTTATYRYSHLQARDATGATRLTWGGDLAQMHIELLRIDGGGHTGASRTEDLGCCCAQRWSTGAASLKTYQRSVLEARSTAGRILRK